MRMPEFATMFDKLTKLQKISLYSSIGLQNDYAENESGSTFKTYIKV